VAFVAFVFDLDLAIKKRKTDTLHPRPTLHSQIKPRKNATNATNALIQSGQGFQPWRYADPKRHGCST